jgi:hypothetical protein
MHFLVAKYLQKDANMTSAAQISKLWRLANEKYSQSSHSTVRTTRAIIPFDMASRTDEEIMEKLYTEDGAPSDFLLAGFCGDIK